MLHKCDKLARLKLIGAQEAQVQEVLRLGGGGIDNDTRQHNGLIIATRTQPLFGNRMS